MMSVACAIALRACRAAGARNSRAAVQLYLRARWQHSQVLKDAFLECQAIVEKHDHENFLWARTLQPTVRPPVMMLRALHAETSLIGDVVAAGGAPLRQIRFQWWKEQVDSVYNGADVAHPVLTALKFTLDLQPLSKYRVMRMLDAKEADQVEHRAPSTLQELEDFTEATQSSLLYLQLQAAGVSSSTADHAASHLGRALGLTSVLRGTAHFAQRGISYLPIDLAAQHGVSAEALFRGAAPRAAVAEVAYAVASAAHGHLRSAEVILGGAGKELPSVARHLMLSRVACALWLQALEKHSFDVLDPSLVRRAYSPLWYSLKLRQALWAL